MLLVITIFYIFFKFSNANCPNGSIASYNDSTICYSFFSIPTYFMDAEETCVSNGGNLASVHSMVDNMMLSQKALIKFTESSSAEFWFGANKFFVPENWSWTDKTNFDDFTNWNETQPSNISGQDCGAIIMQNGRWISEDCFKVKPFVCETKIEKPIITTTTLPIPKPAPPCPESWTYLNVTGFCYKIYPIAKTWFDAEMSCVKEESHLASIHGFQENIFLADLASPFASNVCDWGRQAWIGFSTQENNANWKYSDGTAWDYENWATDQPDYPGTENCGQMWVGSTCAVYHWVASGFNNYNCNGISSNYICKKKAIH